MKRADKAYWVIFAGAIIIFVLGILTGIDLANADTVQPPVVLNEVKTDTVRAVTKPQPDKETEFFNQNKMLESPYYGY